MIRLVPYLVPWLVSQGGFRKSTYVKYLHPLHYVNPEHADRVYLKQWRKNAQPKLNYGFMMSRLGKDLNRTRLAIQYALQVFPGQRMIFMSKLRCQAEYVAGYLQFREFSIQCFCLFHVVDPFLPHTLLWTIWRMSHSFNRIEELMKKEEELAQQRKKRKHGNEPKKKTIPLYKLDTSYDTNVFLYMGGGSSSRAKRHYRDIMLEKATYLSCTTAIAGEAFNVRGYHILVNLNPQKPNGLLEQMEGRIKRGKFVDRVDVVSVIDSGNPTFAETGRKQVRWFRSQRYLVMNPMQLCVEDKCCPAVKLVVDKKSLKAQKEWKKESCKVKDGQSKNQSSDSEEEGVPLKQASLLDMFDFAFST